MMPWAPLPRLKKRNERKEREEVSGGSIRVDRRPRARDASGRFTGAQLSSHPNFRMENPHAGETVIGYALRMCAHLVSPPKEPGENLTMACVSVASQIRSLEEAVVEGWSKGRQTP